MRRSHRRREEHAAGVASPAIAGLPARAPAYRLGIMRNRLMLTFMLALLLGLQGVLWLGDHGLAESWRMERLLHGQQQENEVLRQRNQELQADVLDLKHGTEGLEERARSQLGMIKPGETFYQVIEGRTEQSR